MTISKPRHSPVNGRFAFFQEFLKHPFQIGSVIPSSHYLERRILEAAAVATARTIVELGTGTGGTTRAILGAMPRNARLLSIEINPHFHAIVSGIKDQRLIAHHGDARDLEEIINRYKLDAPDAIISGIPFSTMSQSMGAKVLEVIASILSPNGRFVAYQVSKRVAELSRPLLGLEQMQIELLNIPPMRVFQWTKTPLATPKHH